MGRVSERLRCFICGDGTADAVDYIEVAISLDGSDAEQFFGAHKRHLESVMAEGFSIEIP
jgi:hypothetical protein